MARMPQVSEYTEQIVTRCPFPSLALKPMFQKIMRECARAAQLGDWQKARFRALDARAFAFAHKFLFLTPTEPVPLDANPIWPDLPTIPVYIQFQRLEWMINRNELQAL